MDKNSNLAYLLTYINYWPINFNSSQVLVYFPLSVNMKGVLLDANWHTD